jgi:hypothetical protein
MQDTKNLDGVRVDPIRNDERRPVDDKFARAIDPPGPPQLRKLREERDGFLNSQNCGDRRARVILGDERGGLIEIYERRAQP